MKSLIVALALSLSACASVPRPSDLTSLVKVVLDNGHGSGVYIGNGIIITAAHVVKAAKVVNGKQTVKLKTESGNVQDGIVLWANEAYDIAVVRPTRNEKFIPATMLCVSPSTGDTITSAGSPLFDEFLYIPGTVVGEKREIGPRPAITVAAMPITFGSSGGPVFNDHGDVVGIISGMPVANMGFGQSQTGLAYFVPSDEICALMGRV